MTIKLFIATVAMLVCSCACYAQTSLENKRISISFENKQLGMVFREITDEYGISFSYTSEIAELKMTGAYQNETLKEFLEDLLPRYGLTYKILGDQVTVFRKLSQSTPRQNIKGEVYDLPSKTALPGATVKILHSDPLVGAVTGTDGTFLLKDLPVGRYSLEVSYIGYQTRIIENLVLGAGKEAVVEIGMTEDVNKLQDVVISGYKNMVVPTNQMAVVSARSISSDEAQRFAGSLSDPSRMALSYAGVTSSNGYTNEIIVRGNSPSGLLWRLEGVEIPNPNHYAVEGSSGGFVNILNSTNMARSDFFISAFPSEFGNAASGIFDLKMRKGNAWQREHTLEASTIGLRASTEGPVGGNNGSYLINYRYSLMALTEQLFLKNSDLPEYQDLTFKVNLPSKTAGNFSLFGIGGTGKWDQESSVGYIDFTQYEVQNGDTVYLPTVKSWNDVQHYDLGIAGITHDYSFKNKKTYLSTVVAVSGTRNRPSASAFNYDVMEPYLQERGSYLNSGYRLASTFNHKRNARVLLSGGIKLSYLRYELESESGLPNGTITKDLDKTGDAMLTQGFVSWQYKPSHLWIINTGLHGTHFSLSNEVLVEPRVGIERLINDKQSLSLGAGLHSRHESISTYFGEQTVNGQLMRPNENLKMGKSAHLVLGYNTTLAEDLHLKTEVYLQYRYDIPVENDTQSSYSSLNHDVSFTTLHLVNEGVGKNYGLEVTVEKNFAKQYYFLVTGSVFDSRYKALDGVWRNTRYNTNYAVNLLGGKEIAFGTGGQKVLGVNVRGAITGGKRVVPLDLAASIEAGYGIEIQELAYTQKLSDYYRLDFSLYYSWEKKNISQQLKLDILNLLEQNIYGIRYVQAKLDLPPRIQEYSFNEEDEKVSNLFPVVSYNINF